ncbi:MAG TPA: CsgG/HfaB family protein [Armatimonadota bacterium]|jgi:TolB-like protein
MQLQLSGVWRGLTALCVLGLFAGMALAEPVKLAEATSVKVRLLKTMKSGKALVGELVSYELLADVVGVNGQVLIAKGASASGRVTESKRKGMFGKSGKLEFTIENVTAVDGTSVPLRAVEKATGKSYTNYSVVAGLLLLWPALFVHGEDITVKEGTEYPAYVDGDVMIDPAKGKVASAQPTPAQPAPVQPAPAQPTPAPQEVPPVTIAPPPAPATFVVDPKEVDGIAKMLKAAMTAKPELAAKLANKKIGVVNFRLLNIPAPLVADFISETLVSALLRDGFQVIERNQLDPVVRKLNVTNTADIDPKVAQQIGAQAGCDLLLLGSAMDMGQSVTLNFRLLDAATGQAIYGERLDNVRKIPLAK